MQDVIKQRLEFMAKEFGGSNWVVARRTARIIRKYGADVVCVSQNKYRETRRRADLLYNTSVPFPSQKNVIK